MSRTVFQLRASTADPAARVINNLPGRFPVEDWHVHYWAAGAGGELNDRHCVIQLPLGGGAPLPEVAIGADGIVKRVRRWGVTVASRLFEELGFDPAQYLTHDRALYRSDDEELVDVVMRAANFDLPGDFVLSSDEHPFLLFDPSGLLKGSYTKGHSYLGALTFFVSKGSNTATFNTMRHMDRELYDRAVQTMLGELRKPQQP